MTTRVIIEVKGKNEAQELLVATHIEAAIAQLHSDGGLLDPDINTAKGR